MFSYVLTGKMIIVQLIGLIPVLKIQLTEIQYLRLASRTERPLHYQIRNWISLHSEQPVYLIQTKRGRRIFLSMSGDSHFQLRRMLGETKAGPNRPANRREKLSLQ